MVWGYLQLTGKVEEPFITGVKRIITLVVILGGALDLWLYHDLIIDTFFTAPGAVAAAMIGTYDSVTIVDQVLFTGGDAANLLIQKGGIFQGDFSYYIAGVAVYLIVGITAVYAMFLLTLSKIALSVLLALGPLFISLLFFDTTKRFFESWIAQMANYAFITILIVMVSALMMGVVDRRRTTSRRAGRGHRHRGRRACLHCGGIDFPGHAASHADGRRTRERPGVEFLWCHERTDGLGTGCHLRKALRPSRPIRPGTSDG